MFANERMRECSLSRQSIIELLSNELFILEIGLKGKYQIKNVFSQIWQLVRTLDDFHLIPRLQLRTYSTTKSQLSHYTLAEKTSPQNVSLNRTPTRHFSHQKIEIFTEAY